MPLTRKDDAASNTSFGGFGSTMSVSFVRGAVDQTCLAERVFPPATIWIDSFLT